MTTSRANCVLVIGSTGTGKSSLVGLCTGAHVDTSSGTQECTLDIQAYRDVNNPSGPMWIDSVGFNGTNTDRSDEEAFQYILRFMQEKSLSHIAGVIWTVNPDSRQTSTLQRQAGLIDRFKEGRVWENTVILVKEPRSDLRQGAMGALAAASRFNSSADVRVIGFTYVDDIRDEAEKGFWLKQSREERVVRRYLTKVEARNAVEEALGRLPDSFQVVFCDSQCLDCGVVSDSRLFPLTCHSSREDVHPLASVPHHPARQECLHPGGTSVRHPGKVQYRTETVWHGHIWTSIRDEKRHMPYMSCCGKSPGEAGCQSYHPCCGTKIGAAGCKTIHSCCRAEVGVENSGWSRQFPCCGGAEGSTGCLARCSYCQTTWGTPNNNCIGREHHNVIRIQEI